MRKVFAVTVETDRRQPSAREINNRNAVIQQLADQNLGKFLWSGVGVGCIDFAFEVHDERRARPVVAKAMFNHLPGSKYSIETAPRLQINTEQLESKHGQHAGTPLRQEKPELGMGM